MSVLTLALCAIANAKLSESVQPARSNPGRQRLRSASSLDVIVPRTRTKFEQRAFTVAGPTVRNDLPESVRSAETLAILLDLLRNECSHIHHKQHIQCTNILKATY